MVALRIPVVKMGGGYLKAILMNGQETALGRDEKELAGRLKCRPEVLGDPRCLEQGAGHSQMRSAMATTREKRKRPGRRKLFFRDLVAPALEAKRLRGNSDASLAKDEQRLGRILELIGGAPAREITPGIIERALEALARGDHSDGPLKGSTVNRYHSAVSSVLRYAARQGFIGSNPLADGGVPWSKEQKVHVRFLSGGEEARLLKVIRGDCPDKEAELMLAMLTGMRRRSPHLV